MVVSQKLFSQGMETKNTWEYENMACFSFINYFNTYSLISGVTFISNLARKYCLLSVFDNGIDNFT